MKTKCLSLFMIVLLALMMWFTSPVKRAYAATRTWDGSSNTDWFTAANWVENAVPAAADDVIIGNFVPGNQPTLTANVTVNSLTIRGRSATTSTRGGCLTVNAGVTLTITGSLAINGSSGGVTGVTCSVSNRTGIILNTTAGMTVGGNVTLTNSTGGPPEEPIIVMGSGALQVAGNWTRGSNATFTAGAGTVIFNGTSQAIGGSTTTFNNLTINSGTTTLGVGTSVGGGLTVKSAATLALSSYTLGSPTSVTLEIGSTGSLISGSGALTLGGNLTVNATSGSNGATIAAPLALGGNRTFTVANDGSAATDLTISGVVSGGFSLTKAGAGTLALSGNNTYSGGTTINGGTVLISNINDASGNQNLGSGGITFANGGILQINAGPGFQTTAKAITLNSGGGVINLTGGINTVYLTGAISGGGGLTTGGSDLVLSRSTANTIGPITVASGRLFVQTSLNSISGSTINVQSGAILGIEINTNNTLTNSVVFASGAGLSNRKGTLTVNTSSVTFPSAGKMVFNADDLDTTAITINGNYPTLTGDLEIQVGPSSQTTVGNVTFTNGLNGNYNLNKTSTGTLIFGTGSTVTLKGLTISAGALTSTTGTMSLAGDFTNNSTFNANNGSVVFNGSAAQVIGGSISTTFYRLTINNTSGGVSLGNHETVNNTLTLTSGVLNVAGNTLWLGASASVAGTPSASTLVVTDTDGAPNQAGRLCKRYADGTADPDGVNGFTFPIGDAYGTIEYSPGTLNFGSTASRTNAYACVRVTDAVQPNNNEPHKLSRYWTVTTSGLSGFSSAVTFNYVEVDFSGLDESKLIGAKWDGSNWTLLGAVDPGSNAIIATVTSFSDFTAGYGPTTVTVAPPQASGQGQSIVVSWQAASEVGIVRYRLYRSIGLDGERSLVYETPANTGQMEEAYYEYTDTGVTQGVVYTYWLEVETLGGETEWLPPATALVGGYSIYLPAVHR